METLVLLFYTLDKVKKEEEKRRNCIYAVKFPKSIRKKERKNRSIEPIHVSKLAAIRSMFHIQRRIKIIKWEGEKKGEERRWRKKVFKTFERKKSMPIQIQRGKKRTKDCWPAKSDAKVKGGFPLRWEKEVFLPCFSSEVDVRYPVWVFCLSVFSVHLLVRAKSTPVKALDAFKRKKKITSINCKSRKGKLSPLVVTGFGPAAG